MVNAHQGARESAAQQLDPPELPIVAPGAVGAEGGWWSGVASRQQRQAGTDLGARRSLLAARPQPPSTTGMRGNDRVEESPLFSSPPLPLAPPVLREPSVEPGIPADDELAEPLPFSYPRDAPLGFTGPSGILPADPQADADAHFVPVEDRWRLGLPDWDRYATEPPPNVPQPYTRGSWWNPFHQNVLKGDYPIIGQHTFLNVTLESISLVEGRQVPTGTTPFESTIHPRQEEFFGNPNQFFFFQPVKLSFDLFHGDAAFKPFDWNVLIAPVFNANHLDVEELGVVNPDVQYGTLRARNDYALEEWFVETKIADLGPNYDFVSLRAGSQHFVSDFRGFIFNDTNRAVRLFGTRLSNREQFNLIWFDQSEKETNSRLNTFDDRHQNTLIANYYRQDLIWPGYTAQLSFHYNADQASVEFDRNDFLVRPDPVGVFRPHRIDAYYLGWAGDGHIHRLNVSHALYLALGRDQLNPIAGKPQDIFAQLFAIELSVDRDWVRFRSSFLWASGDDDPSDKNAEGFDSIFENVNFAGGPFSFWQRQAIRLFGVNLVSDGSLLPDMRSSRIQGQSNFVNPGILLYNLGMDADLTPKLKLVGNANFLWFDETEVLRLFTFQDDIHHSIGTDLSLGAEYRPRLNDNIEIIGGISGLIPGRGFKDLYNPLRGEVNGLLAGFIQVVLVY